MFCIYIFFLDLRDVFIWTENLETLFVWQSAGKFKLYTSLHESNLFVYPVFI